VEPPVVKWGEASNEEMGSVTLDLRARVADEGVLLTTALSERFRGITARRPTSAIPACASGYRPLGRIAHLLFKRPKHASSATLQTVESNLTP
jgi:hypothetical protein